MLLEPRFVELRIVERAESRCQPAHCADKQQMPGHDIDNQAKTRLRCEIEAALALFVHLIERIAGRDHIGHQRKVDIRRETGVADFLGCVARLLQ